MGGDSGAGGRAGGAMCSRFGVAFYVNLNGATISPFTYILMGRGPGPRAQRASWAQAIVCKKQEAKDKGEFISR